MRIPLLLTMFLLVCCATSRNSANQPWGSPTYQYLERDGGSTSIYRVGPIDSPPRNHDVVGVNVSRTGRAVIVTPNPVMRPTPHDMSQACVTIVKRSPSGKIISVRKQGLACPSQ